jgi:peptide/nickel transport system ATP-binding protein
MTSLNPVMWLARRSKKEFGRISEITNRSTYASDCSDAPGFVGEQNAARNSILISCLGLRQRAMIAMALAAKPRLLIADEPTTALDVTVQKEILQLLQELRRELGLGLLFITHDLGVVGQVADRVAVLYAGRVIEEGPVGEVLGVPKHPYTQGLLAASPRLERGKLRPIPGTVPQLTALPPGCAFEPRCPLRRSDCSIRVPELRSASAQHSARCVLV